MFSFLPLVVIAFGAISTLASPAGELESRQAIGQPITGGSCVTTSIHYLEPNAYDVRNLQGDLLLPERCSRGVWWYKPRQRGRRC